MTELTPEALAIMAGDDAGRKKGGVVQLVLALGGLTVLAGAGGAALGMLLAAPAAPPAAPPAATATQAAPAPAAPEEAASGNHLLALEPVLTDIASPPGAQLLMEASLVVSGEDADDPLLASQIQADMLVFMRTLELAQLQGARGLLHVKEDLLERARLRSPRVVDIAVRSLVVK